MVRMRILIALIVRMRMSMRRFHLQHPWMQIENFCGLFADVNTCSISSTGELHIIYGKMDSSMYRQILELRLQWMVCKFYGWQKWIFQQDNGSKHMTKIIKEWFITNKISVHSWPSQLPNLNTIENLWQLFKIAVHKRSPKNLVDSRLICMQEWTYHKRSVKS